MENQPEQLTATVQQLMQKSSKDRDCKLTPERIEILKEWEAYYTQKLVEEGYNFEIAKLQIKDDTFTLPKFLAYFRTGLNSRGLVFHGNTGTGKTYHAKMIAKMMNIKFRDEKGLKKLFKDNEDAFKELMSTKYFGNNNNLIVDEIFSENEAVKYGDRTNISELIITLRYDLYKENAGFTIYTTNKNEEQIEALKVDRSLSRLKESCTFVMIDGEDLREYL